mmetsp:Transcript_32966/g.93379  ORF Transcript_32966/g.93379 Transcript_32966/m.93379 type:complete len:135 (-) Transcript_32966:83-487(-)
MATVGDLKDALKETLERSGALEKLRAQVRAEVFKSLEAKEGIEPVPLSDENLIINELIREYLTYNMYQQSESVFIPETGQPEKPAFDRTFLAQHLNLREDFNTRQVPLLYTLISRAHLRGQHSLSPSPQLHGNP